MASDAKGGPLLFAECLLYGRAASGRAPLRQSRRREQEAEGEGGEITLGGSHLSTLSYMLDQEMSIQPTRK